MKVCPIFFKIAIENSYGYHVGYFRRSKNDLPHPLPYDTSSIGRFLCWFNSFYISSRNANSGNDFGIHPENNSRHRNHLPLRALDVIKANSFLPIHFQSHSPNIKIEFAFFWQFKELKNLNRSLTLNLEI